MSTPRTNGSGVGSPYISARKVRGALGETIAAVNQHAQDLNRLKGWIREDGIPGLATAGRADAVLTRGFWGRLRWLLTGK